MANFARVLNCLNSARNILLQSSFRYQERHLYDRLRCASTLFRSYSDQPQEVCSGANIYKEGQDPPLKPDSEYPEWLWTLPTEKVPLEQLSMDDKKYWRKLRKADIKQQNALRKQGKLK